MADQNFMHLAGLPITGLNYQSSTNYLFAIDKVREIIHKNQHCVQTASAQIKQYLKTFSWCVKTYNFPHTKHFDLETVFNNNVQITISLYYDKKPV